MCSFLHDPETQQGPVLSGDQEKSRLGSKCGCTSWLFFLNLLVDTQGVHVGTVGAAAGLPCRLTGFGSKFMPFSAINFPLLEKQLVVGPW